MRSSRVFSILSRFPHASCVASSRGVCLILPDQPLFMSHLRGYRTHLKCPGPGNLRLCGRPFACSHKENCPRWPDFHGNRTHLRPLLGAHAPSLVFPRSGTCCFNQISQPFKRNSSQERRSPLLLSRNNNHLIQSRESCRPPYDSGLSSSRVLDFGLRINMALDRD